MLKLNWDDHIVCYVGLIYLEDLVICNSAVSVSY